MSFADPDLLDDHPRAAAILERTPQIDAMFEDPSFQDAYGRLSLEVVAEGIAGFDSAITRYNAFHRRERRMWSLVISGRTRQPQVRSFVRTIPAGREDYQAAFGAMDRVAEAFQDAGFDEAIQIHLRPVLTALTDTSHPLAVTMNDHMRRLGVDPPMIAEFRAGIQHVGGDILAAGGETLAQLRESSLEGQRGQIEILDHTAEHGFDYLRGRCGPPDWAVKASAILASVGISIAAWWIVVIILALLIVLAVICAVAPHGSWVRQQCEKLNILLPIFNF